MNTSMGHGDLEERGAGDPGDRVSDRELDVLRDAVRLVDGVGELGDGPHHADVVHLLQRSPAQVVERTLASDDQDRRVGAPGVGDAGDTVRNAGAGRDGGDADLAGVAARPGVGRVHRRLLVADVDDPDVLVDAAIVERHDVAAGEREQALDARLLERAGCELPSVCGHDRSLDSARLRDGCGGLRPRLRAAAPRCSQSAPTVSPARRRGQIDSLQCWPEGRSGRAKRPVSPRS
jgi:hypothetical protein